METTYERPELIDLGSLEALTEGGATSGADQIVTGS
ncbi:MAG TPA: lasso RiPP family leader peptide-containing protein [Actinomycetota bacterium]|jgi:hypothetical protein